MFEMGNHELRDTVQTDGAAAFLTPVEVSNLLKVPVKTLAAWRSQRKGPLFNRFGVHVRYPKAHLDAWLAERTNEVINWMTW